MNNKGFTLVELLAVVGILSVVMGIASVGVISAINASKKRSEKIFVDKLSNVIDEYIALKRPSGTSGNLNTSYTFTKCRNSSCNNENEKYTSNAIKVESIYIEELIEKKLEDEEKLINPSNKKKCFEDKNPEIVVYRDTEYVYYYYVDLSENDTNCEISKENSVINTLPIELIKVLKNKENLPNTLLEEVGLK